MGSYLYGRVANGKTIKVQTPGGEVVAGLAEYITKPTWSLFGESVSDFHNDWEKKEIRSYQKLLRNWENMEPQQFLAIKCGKDNQDLHLHQWQGRSPQNHFSDDEVMGSHLVCLGRISPEGVLQPLELKKQKGCTLSVFWDQYIMESPATGKHTLQIQCTPSSRMWDHWNGFLANQPLQADLDHPAYANKVKLKGYTYADGVTVHAALSAGDAAKVLILSNPAWTKEDHRQLASSHREMAVQTEEAYSKALDAAAQKTWGRNFQVTDYRISAIGSDEFSTEDKDILRPLARNLTKHRLLARAHEEAASRVNRYHRAPAETTTAANEDQEAESLSPR